MARAGAAARRERAADLIGLRRRGLRGLLRRALWPLALLCLGGAGGYAYEVQLARPAMVFMGMPEVFRRGPEAWVRVLRNEAFMAGYSEWLGNSLWVSYQVHPRPSRPFNLPRPSRFRADPRTVRCLAVLACIGHDDYSGSGYDRGHLAPNHVIASRYGERAQRETFLMSNISPQRPEFNRQIWQRLEAIAEDDLAQRFGSFWVMTGPIFTEHPQHLPGIKRIAVPAAFYKILIRPARPGEAPRALAFVIPQTAAGTDDLRRFLVRIDDIERWTGIDFFQALPDGIEDAVESRIEPAEWGFDAEVARRAPRYR